jgi:hypothetical protein
VLQAVWSTATVNPSEPVLPQEEIASMWLLSLVREDHAFRRYQSEVLPCHPATLGASLGVLVSSISLLYHFLVAYRTKRLPKDDRSKPVRNEKPQENISWLLCYLQSRERADNPLD